MRPEMKGEKRRRVGKLNALALRGPSTSPQMAEAHVWFRVGHVMYNSQSTCVKMKNVLASGSIDKNSHTKPVMKNRGMR